MLATTPSWVLHFTLNTCLIVLSFIFLVPNTLVLFLSYGIRYTSHIDALCRRNLARKCSTFIPRTILVIGAGTSQGLALARMFFQAGHDVFGVDFAAEGVCGYGKVSVALKKVYTVPDPTTEDGPSGYIQLLLEIIDRHEVDLWVTCSKVPSPQDDGRAKEVIEARTTCKGIQFDSESTMILQEKDTFIRAAERMGFANPETHLVTSPTQVEKIVELAPIEKIFILKRINAGGAQRERKRFSKRTLECSLPYLVQLGISKETPWILQEWIEGPRYRSHALVIRGKVKCFVACPSVDPFMHYEGLPSDSKLHRAMLKFSQGLAAEFGTTFTGQLTVDFLVGNSTAEDPEEIIPYPIRCKPRGDAASILFSGVPKMAERYLSILKEPTGSIQSFQYPVVTPGGQDSYYWIGHDLVAFLLIPLLSLFSLKISMGEFVQCFQPLIHHLRYWKDGTYEIWDPLPWWWLYHIYWPMRFLTSIWTGKRWRAINVCNAELYEC